MKVRIIYIFLAITTIVVSCGNTKQKTDNQNIVLINTDYGSIKIKLYDETPLHRDNFLKLAKEDFYNDLLFHRVIKEFMIQGGDPDSRGASPNKQLGGGGPSYQIDAEIRPDLIHKKGALAAARQGDNINPERKSSGSQFYIVQGKTYTTEELKQFEEQKRIRAVREEGMKIFRQHQALISRLQQEGKTDSINALIVNIQELAEKNVDPSQIALSESSREIYTTIGGTPFLDGSYTVFGEVIEGIEIIDSIAAQETGQGDRPIRDIKMKVEVLE